jgi:hypothetical protein
MQNAIVCDDKATHFEAQATRSIECNSSHSTKNEVNFLLLYKCVNCGEYETLSQLCRIFN